MTKTSLQGLWARKRRLAGTFLAVFIGVAFLSGTLVLGDTLSANFDTLFSSVTKGTDAVVRGAVSVKTERAQPQRGPVDATLLERLRAVPGVAAAEPVVEGYGALIGRDGKAVGGNGPPRLAGNWVEDPDLNPYRLVEGRPPRAGDEVVVNRGAARKADLHVGDRAVVQTPSPVTVRIVGLATFGSADGFGGTTFTAFTLQAAQQHLLSQPGQVSRILAKARPGISQTELVSRIRPVLPPGDEAITGAALTRESINEIDNTFLGILRTFLVIFAAIALVVAAFSIHNTFSIVAAQRSRESALLRALGATAGQVFGADLLGALVVGLVASVAGLGGGVAVAGLLKGMFDAFGFALPAGGLIFTATTVVVSLVVGVAVTVLAGIAPAVRSSRSRPLAALRETALDDHVVSRRRAVAGVALSALGIAVVLAAVLEGSGDVLAVAGIGALLTIVGVVVFGPVAARPVAAVLGAPVARLRGVTGALARGNAMRNPRRTSGTAAALMVGVAVVTLFTVFAASLQASVRNSVSRSFGGDLAITSGRFGRGSLSPALATAVGRAPSVRTAVGLAQGAVRLGEDNQGVTVADIARLGEVVDLDVTGGSPAGGQLAASAGTAKARGWRPGTAVPVTFLDGSTVSLTVGAVYENRDVVGDMVVDRAAWTPHSVQDIDSTVLIKLRPGVDLATGRGEVERVAAGYGSPTVQDRKQYAASLTEGVGTMLRIVYVLLALAVLIALMGIANTLGLSVHERTRELGLLRAVGQTRAQLRSMVRWESVVIATFGALGGLGVGAFLGWALVQVATSDIAGTFSVPAGQLAVVLLAGAAAGVLAAIRPARRAARLPVLSAISSE